MSAAVESLVGRKNIPTGRGGYIPHWYQPHEHPALIAVTRNGKPMGFSVEQVLPERRWAIEPSGELMVQEKFEKWFKQYWAGFGTGDSLDLIPISNVHDFVDRELDAEGHLVKIGFDPNKPASQPLEAKFTQEGELWADKMERLAQQSGETAEALRKQERIKLLGEMLNSGELSMERYAQKVAETMGQPILVIPASAPKPARVVRTARVKIEKITMPCGKEIDPRGRNFHKRKCEICSASPAPEAEAAASDGG